MNDFSLSSLRAAADMVHAQVPPTPQYAWPLLGQRAGCDLWVKHENHTPTGAFKARGAITYIDWLRRTHPEVKGIITATRGNHGQAQVRAATAAGIAATIVVPHGNALEKNAAMRAFGATLIEHGHDFDSAKAEAIRLSAQQGLFMVPAYHDELVRGVASYGLELFDAVPDLDTVYVPVGCGSGLCGTIAARDALGLKTKVVGVVSAHVDAAKRSFEAGRLVSSPTAYTFADGVAVCTPVQAALDYFGPRADRFVGVTDDEVAQAIRIYWQDTHNLAEGAGAVALAALLQEKDRMRGKKVAVILSGGNGDMSQMAEILGGATPQVNQDMRKAI
ncbi:threonine dehydratase [Sphingobium cupriresistens]|uniref:Threonine dehydratase n=1 Tax=Sphingobium cupriresistens TaxID=1132417 RepID=A0A8G1ZIK4_9SPHN|nr:threonine dehydratase [Sphingobium cupriresistens]RYM12630.1 threonine dehydratase [Sphingobium cupriresistens]